MLLLIDNILPDVGETVWRGIGTDPETGEQHKFAGDWRPMLDILNALNAGEVPTADVPDWAVIG